MNATPWNLGPLVSFDTETSGISVDSDRIVTAAVYVPGSPAEEWLAAVEVDIPADAEAVHHISTAKARAEGEPPKLVVDQVTESLLLEMQRGAALVVMNAPFDIPLLDAECVRYGLPTLAERLGRPVGPVVDPLVLDRAVDRYRRGKRTLESLAAHYGVELTDAHSAGADAAAALEVSLAIAAQYPQLQVPAEVLHGWQITWHERWRVGFQEFKRRTDPNAVVEKGWPVREPEPEPEVAS